MGLISVGGAKERFRGININMTTYTKEQFGEWEQEVIDTFTPIWWNQGTADPSQLQKPANCGTRPRDGEAAYVSKTGKKVVVMDPYMPDKNARTVAQLASDPVTCCQLQSKLVKTKIALYHSGNQAFGNVTLGYDAEETTIKLPATDVGGLTNVKLKFRNSRMNFNKLVVDEKVTLFDNDPSIEPTICATSTDEELNEACSTLLTLWSKNNRLIDFSDGSLRENLQKFVYSIRSFLNQTQTQNKWGFIETKLRIATFPTERRVLITQNDVKNKLGKYMIRTYANDQEYAREPSSSDIETSFLLSIVPRSPSIPSGFVTSNINERNVATEYEPLFP